VRVVDADLAASDLLQKGEAVGRFLVVGRRLDAELGDKRDFSVRQTDPADAVTSIQLRWRAA